MPEHQADASTAAILAVAVGQQIIEKLAARGLLTVEEGVDIYRQAVDALSDNHKPEARAILKILMSNLEI